MFKNKFPLILSSIVILIPCIFGIIQNNLSLVILPLITLALQWLCLLITARDPRNKGQNQKMLTIVIWICPVITLFASIFMISVESGRGFSPQAVLTIMLSAIFIVIGNYLPKCKRNSTLGIKIKRTLESDSNWNATHRFAGKLWVICGIALPFCIFLDYNYFIIASAALLLAAVVPPVIYSHAFYKKELKNGTYSPDRTNLIFNSKKTKIAVAVTLTILCVAITFIMFTGDIDIIKEDSKICIEATYWNNITIDTASIESIEYTESKPGASKTNGFNSAKLELGNFLNSEIGSHTRYCYTKCDSAIIIKTHNETYILNLETEEATKALYESLIK